MTLVCRACFRQEFLFHMANDFQRMTVMKIPCKTTPHGYLCYHEVTRIKDQYDNLIPH